jgi:hypothetical protein
MSAKVIEAEETRLIQIRCDQFSKLETCPTRLDIELGLAPLFVPCPFCEGSAQTCLIIPHPATEGGFPSWKCFICDRLGVWSVEGVSKTVVILSLYYMPDANEATA